MSPNSSVFVDSEYETEAGARPRARPNERYDFLKEQGRLNELEQERQMVRYRDRNYFGATQQRLHTGTDRLAVPVYEERRRPRARSDTRSRHRVDELSRGFRTLEVRPSAELVSRRNEPKDRVEVNEVLRGSNQSRDPVDRPNIKIPPIIVQEHPPVSSPGKASSASPRSPSGQPQLQLKYLVLQNKLADISLSCIRYLDVEASNPRDLTFEKISEQVKGFAFDLHVWSHLANIQNMSRSDVPEDSKAVAHAASRNMDRLNQTAKELHNACSDAKPGDLKLEELGKVDDEDNMFDNVDDERHEQDLTESIGYKIEASLQSIKLQIKNLKRLTRSLQDATPDAREEVAAVTLLVGEVGRYFGSETALQQYAVDKKFSGRRALEEARYAAAR